MVIISPSILSCDFLNIENELRALEPCKNIWIHLDIMDSHFVPNLTFGGPVVKNLHKITKKQKKSQLYKDFEINSRFESDFQIS